TLSAGGVSAQSGPVLPVAAPGEGAVRALIVGINDYVELPNLRGAVADARDLEATLKKASVQDLTIFINRNATRRAIEDAMMQLIARTRAGDLVIIAFAGHGAQQVEQVKGSEPDGMDEVFVLSNFRRAGPGTAERILDNEINAWLMQLEQRGAVVLFI